MPPKTKRGPTQPRSNPAPPRSNPACVAILDDGKPCGARPSEGNPPLCDECYDALGDDVDALDKMNELSDRALTLFDKIGSMWNRAAAALRTQGPPGTPPPGPRPTRQPPRQTPPRPPHPHDANANPHGPSQRPPPPRPGSQRPPERPGAMGLSQALYEFGWGPTKVFTSKDVKTRRKELAVAFHGDKTGGFDGRMKAINEACGVLLKHAQPAPKP